MKRKGNTSLIGIWVLGIYNIILGILNVTTIPITLFFSKRFESVDKLETATLVSGLLPMILLGIFYAISGFSFLKCKEWGRKCVLLSSIVQSAMGLYLIISGLFIESQKPLITNFVMVFVAIWAIYYLNKQSVKQEMI